MPLYHCFTPGCRFAAGLKPLLFFCALLSFHPVAAQQNNKIEATGKASSRGASGLQKLPQERGADSRTESQVKQRALSGSSESEEPRPPTAWQGYPVIPELSQGKGVFKQFLIEVEENKKRWAQYRSFLPITLYVYRIRAQDSIFSISAKASISMESIATLNRIEHPGGLPLSRNYILLPNNSGVFLPQDQSQDGREQQPYQSLSAWEQRLRQNRDQLLFHRLVIGQRAYFYYPKSRFGVAERRYFLDNVFRSPIQQRLHITSGFGVRRDPITGKSSFHDGLDIRSPYGAPIYSIANGTVLEFGENRLYGLYVKVRLDNGKEQVALYGHLTAVLVRKGQRVSAGEVIGNSGQSGRSTGPHLHLTIFQSGKAVNPAPLFRKLY